MSTKSTEKKSGKRDNPRIMNFLTVGGMTLSLGDLRKADFSALQDPKASVNSLKTWAIQLNNILRGFSQEEA